MKVEEADEGEDLARQRMDIKMVTSTKNFKSQEGGIGDEARVIEAEVEVEVEEEEIST